MTASSIDMLHDARRAHDGKLLLAVLIHLQAIMDVPTRWTRVALARTSKLETILPLSGQAVCWSLSGALALALFQVLGSKMMQAHWERLYSLTVDALWDSLEDRNPRSRQHGKDLDDFNDFEGTTFEDVADLLDRVVSVQRVLQGEF
jgi:hypothetical protein